VDVLGPKTVFCQGDEEEGGVWYTLKGAQRRNVEGRVPHFVTVNFEVS